MKRLVPRLRILSYLLLVFSYLIYPISPILVSANEVPPEFILESEPVQEVVSSNQETFENVVVNLPYRYSLNQAVELEFKSLPEGEFNLSIEQKEVQVEGNTVLGFDITSNLVNGTFEYSLKLPNLLGEDFEVKYSEDNTVFNVIDNVSSVSNQIYIDSLNHFTIFVVVAPAEDPSVQVNCDSVALGSVAGTTCFSTIQSAIDAAAADPSSPDVINIAEGVYEENLIIKSSDLTLLGQGINTILSPSVNSDAITFSASHTNVRIANFQIDRQDGQPIRSGLRINPTSVNGLVLEDLTIDGNNGGANGYAGIYLNGPVDNVTMLNNSISNFTQPTSRGIVIWNGLKSNINIQGNTISNVNCCGIEMQDGTASAVNISNNTLLNMADSSISIVGGNNSVGNNIISNNNISSAGRFGIEVKGGSNVSVFGNTITGLTPTNNRDRAGIAVGDINTKGCSSTINLYSNTISNFQQPAVGFTGFGISASGSGIAIENNSISNTDVAINIQQGFLGDQDTSGDEYFGRDNCTSTDYALVQGNTFTSNTLNFQALGGATYMSTPVESDSAFMGTPKYVREGNFSSDVVAQIRVPTYAESVRFVIDGVDNANYHEVNDLDTSNNAYDSDSYKINGDGSGTQWWRVQKSLLAGEYSVTAEFLAGGTWYPVTGSGTVYSIDLPDFSYVTPAVSGLYFRPSDNFVRISHEDQYNQFQSITFRIYDNNGTTGVNNHIAEYTVNRADCDLRQEGNYVICDLVRDFNGIVTPLLEGSYFVRIQSSTHGGGGVRFTHTNANSFQFYIDSNSPTLDNFSIENSNPSITYPSAGIAMLKSQMVLSANASDDNGDVESGVKEVRYWITLPREDGVCTGNGDVLLSSIVDSTDIDGKFRTSLDLTTLADGTYCVSARSADNANSHSTPVQSLKFYTDKTAPSVPVNGTPHNVAIPTNNFDFNWDESTDLNPVMYEFQSSLNPAQVDGVLTTSLWKSPLLPNNLIVSTGAPDGKWYWQVRAIDTFGNTSAWSEIWNVTLDTVAPIADITSHESGDTVNGIQEIRGSIQDLNPWRYYFVITNSSNAIVGGPGTVYDSTSFTDKLLLTLDTDTLPNGAYTIKLEARDLAGNKTAVSSDWVSIVIDNANPDATISYSTTLPTNQDVIATLIPNEVVTVTNNGGSDTFVFTDNGTFTFEFEDGAGNTGTATAIVNNIDKVAPILVTRNLVLDEGSVLPAYADFIEQNPENLPLFDCIPLLSDSFMQVTQDTLTNLYCSVIDDAGNIRTSSATLTVLNIVPSVTIDALPSANVLSGQTINLTANGVGANGPLTYLWSNECSGTDATTTFTSTVLGQHICTVTVTDNDGDTDVQDVIINIEEDTTPTNTENTTTQENDNTNEDNGQVLGLGNAPLVNAANTVEGDTNDSEVLGESTTNPVSLPVSSPRTPLIATDSSAEDTGATETQNDSSLLVICLVTGGILGIGLLMFLLFRKKNEESL